MASACAAFCDQEVVVAVAVVDMRSFRCGGAGSVPDVVDWTNGTRLEVQSEHLNSWRHLPCECTGYVQFPIIVPEGRDIVPDEVEMQRV